MIKARLKILTYKEQLKELVLFTLEKKGFRGDHITVLQYLQGSYKEDRGSLFIRSLMKKTKGKEYSLHLIFHPYCLHLIYIWAKL